MTTQTMYDNGLRCKGRTFNCYKCKNKYECVEYLNMNVEPEPLLDVISKHVWDKKRIQILKDAIIKCTENEIKIPNEWIDEYNDLIELYSTNKTIKGEFQE